MLKGKKLGMLDTANWDERMWDKKRGNAKLCGQCFTRGMQSPAGNAVVRNPVQSRPAISSKTAHPRVHHRKGS